MITIRHTEHCAIFSRSLYSFFTLTEPVFDSFGVAEFERSGFNPYETKQIAKRLFLDLASEPLVLKSIEESLFLDLVVSE